MHESYIDITEKLGDPLWWDENAVPRYCEFTPSRSAYIYADEVVLLEIRCQACLKRFKVAMSSDTHSRYRRLPSGDFVLLPKMSSRIDSLHYGDPPNYSCCPAGPTMNSEPIRVLEFWERTKSVNFARRKDLERELFD